MYNTYNSLIHELIKDQSQYERLRQSEEKEIPQINREVREASSSRDNAIQAETKKIKDQIAQSRRELESKKQKYEAALKSRVEKIADDTADEVASTVVKKKTEILNGLINKLKIEQQQMIRKVESEVKKKTEILNGLINKLKIEQQQIPIEMQDTLREQGSPIPFESESKYLGKYYYGYSENTFFNIPKYIVYPIIGISLTGLSIFFVLLINGIITIPNHLSGYPGLIFLLLLFYLKQYVKYNKNKKQWELKSAAAWGSYNNELKKRQLDFDNIIAKSDDPIVAFSNELTEYLSPTSLEKRQTLIKKYNEIKAKIDSLIKLRDSIGKGQEFDYLIAKSHYISEALKSNDLTKNSLPTDLEDSKILVKKYKENEIKHDYLIILRDSLSKAKEVTKLREKSAEITSKYYVDFGLTPTTQDLEKAPSTQDIKKAAPSKNIEKKKVGIYEFVPREKRRKVIDADAYQDEDILDIPTFLKKQMDSEKDFDPDSRKKFFTLVQKLYDRDDDLGACFERNISFENFEDNKLTWGSMAEGADKKMLITHWGLINMFVKDLFGFDTKIINIPKKNGSTALIEAALKGDQEMMQLLLDRGANIDVVNQDGRTALMVAAEEGHQGIVELLLDRGANIDAVDEKGDTALSRACYKNQLEIVALLLERGAEIMDELLAYAAEYRPYRMVELLLDRGANIEDENDCGSTPLVLASLNGDQKMIQLLLDRGADINNGDWTPLMSAALYGQQGAVELLLDNGANTEAVNMDYETALMIAEKQGEQEIVKLLLERGASKILDK